MTEFKDFFNKVNKASHYETGGKLSYVFIPKDGISTAELAKTLKEVGFKSDEFGIDFMDQFIVYSEKGKNAIDALPDSVRKRFLLASDDFIKLKSKANNMKRLRSGQKRTAEENQAYIKELEQDIEELKKKIAQKQVEIEYVKKVTDEKKSVTDSQIKQDAILWKQHKRNFEK